MVSLEIVCDTPTPSSSTMNDTTTAATDRSWRNSRMSRKPADTRMSPATIRVQGANLSGQPHDIQTADHRHDRTRQRDQPGGQWRQSEDQLQVL